MLPDYHVHTYYSGDCDVPIKEHIKKAISSGMKEICFTDHTDYDYPPENGVNIFEFNVNDYFNELMELKNRYADKISIKIGIELGLNPCNVSKNRLLTDGHDFDFVIGSSHIIDGKDPYYESFWENRNPDDVIYDYFMAILTNVKNDSNYDVYGHLDYIRRYVPSKEYVFDEYKFKDITDEILKTIIQTGHGIELNTRGLSYGSRHFAPTINLLKAYHNAGGEILTIGSDSHVSDTLGYKFDYAKEIIKDCGFRYITGFCQRKPEFYKI